MSPLKAIAIPAFALATVAGADVYEACYSEPDYDRWMYPYNGTPGTRTAGPTFGGVYESIDDRYGQTFFGWVTIDVPIGKPASSYRITSMSAEISLFNGDEVIFDNSADLPATHFADGPVDDPGRPFYLSGAGFRGDFNATTFGEDGPHPFGAGAGFRNVYPIGFDENGVMGDISNNLTEGFDVKYFSVGDNPDYTLGEFMPEVATINFDLDVEDKYISCYLKEALAFGTLDLVLTSLHTGSHDGGSYPQWVTKDNVLGDPDFGGYAAKLCLEVEVVEPSGVVGDVTGDGIGDQ